VETANLHVVATAGHVDHGKSALVLRLTGMDPDRLDEEKRRGLTIDLGFAWVTLPSGHEVGFVDVPGHERFVRNMLAGVGPGRLVLFVVAADEGWKPQSEEHLAIVDLLGVDGSVVALTKSDLVDGGTLVRLEEDFRDHLRGTALEGAPMVPCSSYTGDGMGELVAALDDMVRAAPVPRSDPPRPRQFVDRVFTVKGAGTVVTGTLTGGALAVGDEVELYPSGLRARVRGLQTHKRAIERAFPVSRVAVGLASVDRGEIERGDALGLPGQWRPTSVFEARVRPIRGLTHPLTPRGAFKLYVGSAERDARLRFYTEPAASEGALARIRMTKPLALDVFDRFILREAGRHETVAGGVVLDIDPPSRPGADPAIRLAARERASREQLPGLLVLERGAAKNADILALTGAHARGISGAVRAGDWRVSERLHREVAEAVASELTEFHRGFPLREGAALDLVRTAASDRLAHLRAPADPGLVQGLLDDMNVRGVIVRDGPLARLASHRVAAEGPELYRLVQAVASAEPAPPTATELIRQGFERDLIEAAAGAGALVTVSPDLVMTAGFVDEARRALCDTDWGESITVSAFRERIGTSRKYALPLLEYFDREGVTLRRGDVRVLRSKA